MRSDISLCFKPEYLLWVGHLDEQKEANGIGS